MIAAIIQARMGAKRLPGKVLKEVNGTPLLKFQVNRVKQSALLDKIVVATSVVPGDDAIADFCMCNKIDCFRGSENNVLGRYYECAKQYGADVIVRLTGDCPLVDPEVLDNTIRLLQQERTDFAANTVPPQTSCFPDGSDVEVFTMRALQRAYQECKNPYDREHVTFYFWKYENGFKTAQLKYKKNYSQYRFTIDYPEDLEVFSFIVSELWKQKKFGHLEEIIEICEVNPKVCRLNAHHAFGEGWQK